MADKEGHVTVADKQMKSLVSEQYQDGFSYDDDDDDSGSAASLPPSAIQATVSEQQGKRRYSSEESGASNEESTKKKKFSMSLSSGKEGGGSGKPEGPSLPPSSTASSRSPPKMSMTIGLSNTKLKPAPIKMNLSSQIKPKVKEVAATPAVKKSSAVAQAFGDDSEESEEEMPAEARMRMRNIGRETPTAAGPNSFGKGRLGFCDRQKIIERELQKSADDTQNNNAKLYEDEAVAPFSLLQQ